MNKSFRIWMAKRQARKDLKAFQAQRHEFYEDLATAHGDGIDTATHLKRSAERLRKRDPAVSRVINQILNNLVGEMLSQALRRIVPDSERMIIAAAEQSGRLIRDLHFLAETTAMLKEMTGNLRSALVMPVITLIISWANVWMVSYSMLPMIDEMIPADRLQGGAAYMYYLCYAVSYATIPLAVVATVLVVRLYYRLPDWTGARRRKLDNYFPFSMYRDWHGALFILSLGSLIRSGSGLTEAISEIGESGSKWLRWHCKAMLNKLAEHPDKPGLAFDTGILPAKIVNRLVDVGDRSQIGDHLEKIGADIVKQTNKRIAASAMYAELIIGFVSSLLLIGITLGMSPLIESTLNTMAAMPK